MKKILFVVLALFANVYLYAQDAEIADLKRAASAAYKENNMKLAFDNYNKAVLLSEQQGKTDSSLYFNAAVTALKSSDYVSGEKYFEKCVTLQYKAETCYKFLGMCQQQNDNYEGLMNQMTIAHSLFPQNEDISKLLGAAYINKGKASYQEGAEFLSQAKKITSDEKKYNELRDKGIAKFEEALPIMEKAYSLNPQSKPAIQALVSIYANLGNVEKAADFKDKLNNL